MKLIEEYILLSKEERQQHLDLSESCIERGGKRVSTICKGLLAHVFDTTIPEGHKIHVCHACNNDKCSNWKHLYFGTAQENLFDAFICGANRSHIIRSERARAKYEANPKSCMFCGLVVSFERRDRKCCTIKCTRNLQSQRLRGNKLRAVGQGADCESVSSRIVTYP